ncbi:DUF4214 domain-containing protein [Massilia agri]|uniref:DUF4214 domain-containing protein n=1 Tax=Massilia agri TaxID=1886785 RepID=A0ABT2AMN0_9BURK|nr:DUF4214 domain-containing protein [Massilia agri]MCS0597478.1 DUF4214 domain-containing protein [Massilia agri]
MSIIDYAPVGIVDDRDTLLTSLQSGAVAATLTAVDTGPLTGGRWVIDAQSNPGLFSIAYNPAVDETARLVLNNAALLPEVGAATTVTVHYYDKNQLDAWGNPRAGTGFTQTLIYNVEAGSTRELDGFGSDLGLGLASSGASPELATLSTGQFLAVWESRDGAINAQVRDAAGGAATGVFAITAANDGVTESAPAVAALSDGRAVVAYTSMAWGTPRVSYRITDSWGNLGQEVVVGAGGDTGMPDVVALADGGAAIAWRVGGQIHVRTLDAAGNLLAGEQVYGKLGTAFSPSLAAVGGSYVVSWGEIGDGNVYAALNGGAPFLASGDGLAATLATAAPLPSITTLAGGGFVVAWDSYANSPWGYAASDIFFQMFDAAGNRIGGMTQANVDGGSGRFDAHVTALSDGGFVVTWESQSGDFDGNGVFGRRFGADGAARDAREFAINEYRQGDQSHVAVTALSSGGFASAWVDTQADGSSTIEARVLAGEVPVNVPELVSVAPVPVPPPAPTPTPKPTPTPTPTPTTPTGSGSGNTNGGGSSTAPGLTGNNGADQLKASAGSQKIDGMGGIDTVVFGGLKKQFDIMIGASSVTVKDRTGTGGSDTLVNVERLSFGDVSVALDIDGNAGQAYRLYQAAFDRTPDRGGLGFWIKMLDKGLTLQEIAPGFTDSAEFDQLYGVDNSNADFVGLLYSNALHRTPDAEGFDFWMAALDKGYSRSDLLAYFSESAENQAQVIGSIQHGIEFTPYG